MSVRAGYLGIEPDAATDRRPRVSIVTNGIYFAYLGLRQLLENCSHDVEFQIVCSTGLRRTDQGRLVQAFRLARRWGARYTAFKASMLLLPWWAELTTRRPFSVHALAKRLGLEVWTARNVNEPAVLTRIQDFRPDLLLSFSCPYRLDSSILALPRVGCLNVHSSLLPRYAGVCTYVHVLADGERETGVTVHEMVERFDAGRIVAQASLAIAEGESVYTLFARQCDVAAMLLVDTVPRILLNGEIEGAPQDFSKRSYRGEPRSADIHELRRRGFALFRPRDLERLLGVHANLAP